MSDSEVTALAVVPTGWPSASTEVTTVTPVAKWPIASRNSAADTPEAARWTRRRIRGHGAPPVS